MNNDKRVSKMLFKVALVQQLSLQNMSTSPEVFQVNMCISTNNGRCAKIDNVKTIDNALGAVKLSGLMDVTI